jgi:hypothetical protein
VRLTNDMGKVKTICRILVPALVVLGMALSPFPAMETASASSVSDAWVELSDGTVLNSTSTADEDMLVGEGYWIYMLNDCTLVGFTATPIEPSLD